MAADWSGGSFLGSTPGKSACSCAYRAFIVTARSSVASESVASIVPFVELGEAVPSLLIFEFGFGDDLGDFTLDDWDDNCGALIIAGCGGICDDGLWERSAIAAR